MAIINKGLKFAVISALGLTISAFTQPSHASLMDGVIDTWNVNVSSIFDTATVVDSNGNSPGGVTIVNNQSLRWGTGAQDQSGLDISNSPSNTYVDTNGPAVANVSFSHLNRPINGTTLSSVDVLSTLVLTPFEPSGSALPSVTLTFGINYLETPNGSNPCADGDPNGVGVNSNGCADIYVIDQNSLNFAFDYDLDGAGELPSVQYFISFFELTSGLNPLSAAACAAVGVSSPCLGFETPEGADTTVQFGSVITTTPLRIPEPGTMALVAVALLGGAFARKRSRAHN